MWSSKYTTAVLCTSICNCSSNLELLPSRQRITTLDSRKQDKVQLPVIGENLTTTRHPYSICASLGYHLNLPLQRTVTSSYPASKGPLLSFAPLTNTDGEKEYLNCQHVRSTKPSQTTNSNHPPRHLDRPCRGRICLDRLSARLRPPCVQSAKAHPKANSAPSRGAHNFGNRHQDCRFRLNLPNPVSSL